MLMPCWHSLPILAALLLLALLIGTSDLTPTQLGEALDRLSAVHVVAFVMISFAMLGLSAVKWRLVMAHLPASPVPVPSLSASVFYTCLGAALGIVLMPHAAKVAGRALGARLHGAQPIGKSAVASVFEQVFDLAAIVLFAAFGVALLAPQAIPVIGIVLVIGGGGVVFLAGRPHVLARRLPLADLTRLLRRPVAITLGLISLVIYGLGAVRTGLIAAAMGLALLPAEVFASFSLVQVSRLVAVTPMGLGIADWTWAGVLGLLEVPLAVTAGFVLLNRGLNVLSILAALVLASPLALLDRRRST